MTPLNSNNKWCFQQYFRKKGLYIFITSYCLYRYLKKCWVIIILQHEVQPYSPAFNILNQFSMFMLCLFLFFTTRQCTVFNPYMKMSVLTRTFSSMSVDDPVVLILIHIGPHYKSRLTCNRRGSSLTAWFQNSIKRSKRPEIGSFETFQQ